MKKNNLVLIPIIFLIIFLIFYYKNYSNNECFTLDKSENIVKEIEKSINEYSVTYKDIFDKSSEGGQQANYILNGQNIMIKQTFFGETGKSEIFFYLNKEKVFFIKKINTVYLLPLSEDSSGKIKEVINKEFYLNKNQELCSWYLNRVLQENDLESIELVNYLISNI